MSEKGDCESTLPTVFPDMRLEDARHWLFEKLSTGHGCPCCGQFAKRYRYCFSENVCRFLMVLYRIRKSTSRFIHVTEILKYDPQILMSRDFLRPAFYGLIEEAPNPDDAKKKRSGLWRISNRGVDFCEGQLEIQKYVVMYDGRVLWYEEPWVKIWDFNGEHFNYQDAMRSCELQAAEAKKTGAV